MGRALRQIVGGIAANAGQIQAEGANGDVERREPANELSLGQWYWVLPSAEEGDQSEGDELEDDDEPDEGALGADEAGTERADKGYGPAGDANAPVPGAWLACARKIGSNFVELEQPTIHGASVVRVHLKNFWRDLKLEPNPDQYLRGKAQFWQREVGRLVDEMNTLCARLGLRRQVALPGAAPAPSSSGSELVVLSGQVDPKEYERALVRAKEKQLPELDKAIHHAAEQLARWMKATTLSARAAIVPLHETIETVNDRIFTVGLYAGLTEKAVLCCDGAAAADSERLHVMQRMLFMDEECLLDWTHGGMEFKSLKAFEKWLCRPHNRDRILPFPRTLVAMRVRREVKDREFDGSLLSALVKIYADVEDKYTYLYVRNGEQVWRVSCAIEFPELIFPDQAMYSADQPLMAKNFAGSVSDFMSLNEYEQCIAERKQAEEELEAWKAANPGKDEFFSPAARTLRQLDDVLRDDWHKVTPDWVYYDEAMAVIEAKVKEFNRIAVIIQGLFDRSKVLLPHPPVRSWTADGFDQAIKLVYDSSNVLNYGEPPDFEAYRAKCNASLGVGSIVVGQEDAWERREGEKETRRANRNSRGGFVPNRKRYRPHGDPGPGLVARVETWKARRREAVFTWLRRSQQWRSHVDVQCSLTVSAKELFNISEYRMGDYLQFFRDPRTRAQYLKWAPMLLAAEEYHAGKIKIGSEGS